jgi:regulator of sigma E protease
LAVLHSLQTIVTFLIVLGVLVVAHEWGHFIIARLFKIRVDDFSIGFGKRLVRLGKRGDTEYNIRMLPLGGFVKIAGMEVDEAPLIQAKERMTGNKTKSDDPDAGQLPLMAENTGESEPYLAPDGFNAKPLWQRALVILAGPVMSFLLGYLIVCLMGWTVGLPMGNTLNKIGEVEPGGEGQHIGLHAGDMITAINGTPISNGDQMVQMTYDSLGHPLTLTILRDGQTLTKIAHTRPMPDDSGKPAHLVLVKSPGPLAALGIQPNDVLLAVGPTEVKNDAQALQLLSASAGKPVQLVIERGAQPKPLSGTLPKPLPSGLRMVTQEVGILNIQPMAATERVGFLHSIDEGNAQIVGIFQNLAHMIRHGQLHKQVGGVIVMYQMTSIAIDNGLVQVLWLAAQLSISLAIFNLLPIPILDGGHLLNFLIEWVRGGKKMSEEGQQRFMLAGLAIIGTLFIWIMTKNILQVIFHQLPQ